MIDNDGNHQQDSQQFYTQIAFSNNYHNLFLHILHLMKYLCTQHIPNFLLAKAKNLIRIYLSITNAKLAIEIRSVDTNTTAEKPTSSFCMPLEISG